MAEALELLVPPKKRRLALSRDEESKLEPTKKKARWQLNVEEETRKKAGIADIKNRPHEQRNLSLSHEEYGQPKPTEKKKRWLFDVEQEARKKPGIVDIKNRPQEKRNLSLSHKEDSQPKPTEKKERWSVDVEEEARKKPGIVDIKNWPYKKLAATGATPCRGLLATLLRLGIDRPIFLFEKNLFHSDIDSDQNRLQLKESVVESSPLMRMLTEEEEAAMKDPKIGLPVTVLDPLAREYRMTLKKLGTRYYRFMGEYGKLVKDNKVKIGHILDILGFRLRGGRQDGELRFAMLNYGREEIDEEGDELTADEKEAVEALLELRKRPVIFQH